MRILFIRPNMSDTRSSDALEPLVFGILKALSPSDVDFVLFDDRIEAVRYDEDADLVAITVETYTAKRAYMIAAQFRKRGIPVVMGGFHPTFMQDEALMHADFIIVGNAEGAWQQLLHDLKKGVPVRKYVGEHLPDLSRKAVDRSLFPVKRYLPLSLVQYGRGCRYRCDFCSIHNFYGHKLYQRPLSHIIMEIGGLKNKLFFFTDDNLFTNRRKAKELFTALIPLKKKWICQISIDIAADTHLLELMKKSGCLAVIIGFESLDDRNLTQMNKQANLTLNEYPQLIANIHNAGIMIYATFVFGYDHDTPAVINRTVDFSIASNFFLANFNPLTPMPGTALYDRLEDEKRLIYDAWWLHPDYTYGSALFYPKSMSPDELSEGCYQARLKFNRHRSIFKRAFGTRANSRTLLNLGVHLIGNWISRKEIINKQGRLLGEK